MALLPGQQAARIVERWSVNAARDWKRLQGGVGIRLQQRKQPGGIAAGAVEPERLVFRAQDRGHPVVDRRHQCVWRDRDNGTGSQRRAILLAPLVPQTRESEQAVVFTVDIERLTLTVFLLPLIKAV